MIARSLLLVPLLLFVGCGDDPAPAAKPAPPAATQLDSDIRKVGVASAAGYDGTALQVDVQSAVDAQQRHNAQTDAARTAE